MVETYLMSTAVMGLLLVLVISYISRAYGLHRRLNLPVPRIDEATPSTSVPAAAIVGSIAGIVLLAMGVSVGIWGDVSGISLAIGLLTGTLGLYLVWGTYHIARSRRLTHAQAVGVGSWFLGLLLLLGVVAKLLSG